MPLDKTVKVHFLAQRQGRARHTTFPLEVFTPQLGEQGLQVAIFHDAAAPELPDCDLLVLVEADFRDFFPAAESGREAEVRFLEQLRAAGCRTAWFDDSDSAGCLRTYLLPQTDRYIKAQVMRDRTAYTRPSRTGSVFLDYYCDFFGVAAPARRSKGAVTVAEAEQIALGWSFSFSDWMLHWSHHRLALWYRTLKSRVAYPEFPPVKPLAQRAIAVNCRLGLHPGRPPVHELRRHCLEQVETLAQRRQWVAATAGLLRRAEYLPELRESVAVASPFGHGELCFRDFECFAAGAVLLKQNMDHVETWPNYYEPHVTYVPFAWDFSDFEEKLTDIVAHPARYEAIAAAGRERFLHSLSPAGGAGFARHLKQLVEQALAAPVALPAQRQEPCQSLEE